MAQKSTDPDWELTSQVAAMVAAGASIPAATRAVGIPSHQVEAWRRAKRSGRATPKVIHFLQELEKASGLAKAQAQVRTLKDKPLDWLKNTLRPRPPSKAATAKKRREEDLSTRTNLWLGLLNTLESWPDAREAAARWLRELQEPPADSP